MNGPTRAPPARSGAFGSVLGAGGREMLAPKDFPGGRFAIVSDPQGAAFGLHKIG